MWIRCASIVIVIALACTGCSSRGQSLRWMVVGVGMTTAGAGMLYSLREEEEVPGPILVTTGGLLIVGATVTLLTGINAILVGPDPVYDNSRIDDTPELEAAAARAAVRTRAWTLTKAAAAAARASDCAAVREADVVVRDLDAEFHAIVFRRDVAIARCLAD